MISGLNAAGVEAKVIVGGIIPNEDGEALKKKGVTAVYTPKDFSLSAIMSDLLSLVEASL